MSLFHRVITIHMNTTVQDKSTIDFIHGRLYCIAFVVCTLARQYMYIVQETYKIKKIYILPVAKENVCDIITWVPVPTVT